MPLKCPRCGKYLDDDETVCPNCGEDEGFEDSEFYDDDESLFEDSYEDDIYSYEHDDFKEIKDYSDDLLDEEDSQKQEPWKEFVIKDSDKRKVQRR